MKKNLSYIDSVHRDGTIWNLTVMVLLMAFPLTVAFLFGGQLSLLSRIIYTLVGAAGLWCITLLFQPNRDDGHTPHTA